MTPAPGPDGRDVLCWRFDEPRRTVSSAAVGGGTALSDWVLNIEVNTGYARTDLDAHVAEVADWFGLEGSGVGLLTAARVARVRSSQEDGVVATVTTGLSHPRWAAAPDEAVPLGPGTINIVVEVPQGLSDAAMVNAVMTATEAKTQALVEGGVEGTGTASDAVVVCCPPGGHEPFAGTRSVWGARVARCVHAAVAAGIDWSP